MEKVEQYLYVTTYVSKRTKVVALRAVTTTNSFASL